MPSMATIISSHNKNLLSNKQEPKTTIPPCNCCNSAICPLNGECREKAVTYKASITSDGSSKRYIGCTDTEFKTRYYNHTHSFRYREKRNATELSKAFWNAKDSGHEPVTKWSIANRATACQPGSQSCNLCLTEKLAILLADKRTALNKRSELTGKCWLKNKYRLKNVRPYSFYFILTDFLLTDVLIRAAFQRDNTATAVCSSVLTCRLFNIMQV